MAKEKIKKRSTISIDVGLNPEQMPVELHWRASDRPGPSEACKGMLLALFNEQSKETMKIDLWTKDMQVVEMDRFMYQTLRGLADTYFKATGNQELANQMQQFVFFFGQATGAIPKEG
jgi:gliding motility-associated protein GldC